MSEFLIQAIATEVAEGVRNSGRAPQYGHPALTERASGHGPCRHCLQTFRVGQENRILFTYNSFTGLEGVPLPGPIFIHERECKRYPEEAGYPPDLMRYAAVLNAYAAGQMLVGRVLLAPEGDKTAEVDALLCRPEVSYIEVRDGVAGCFDFHISRR